MSKKTSIIVIILNSISFILGLTIIYNFKKDYDFFSKIMAIFIIISSTIQLGKALKELIRNKSE